MFNLDDDVGDGEVFYKLFRGVLKEKTWKRKRKKMEDY